ncbi:hypothetical protein [Bacillus sp. HMF5848]|uniref:hypothetical protein n=1 Tax=Bacillus sp. HMF5848 TaxID=2495421 RepID=UPI001639D658|nr:hypothetical protein [Bacillus sp. HMF5848]
MFEKKKKRNGGNVLTSVIAVGLGAAAYSVARGAQRKANDKQVETDTTIPELYKNGDF